MLYDICRLFLIFLIYSTLGYITELIYCSIQFKKIVLNRGFFLGPYLPIYGICCILMTFFLEKYSNDIIVLYIMSVVLCSVIEFFTSYILEKIYKVRWWDYSDFKFNFEGRICLLNSCLFGFCGVILILFLNPIVYPIIDKLSDFSLVIISICLAILFLMDLFISIKTLHEIKVSSEEYADHDATEEIKLFVKQKLSKGTFLISRLLNAFPSIGGRDMIKFINLKKFINDLRKKLKLQKNNDKKSKKRSR